MIGHTHRLWLVAAILVTLPALVTGAKAAAAESTARAPLTPLPAPCRLGLATRACRCAIDASLAECAPCRPATREALTDAAEQHALNGRWDEARHALFCALEGGDAYPPAQHLLDQLLSEPFNYFEGIFGPGISPYVTRPGDTLASIAKRCLNDARYFVALARLNDVDPSGLRPEMELAIPRRKPCDPAPIRRPAAGAPDTAEADRPTDPSAP